MKKDEVAVSFVILHYLDFETTVTCVRSIEENIAYDNYSIVIVDNASPNSTGKKLQNQYERSERIHVILSEKNLGFAQGNNVGYEYAKNELNSHFIVVMNNDVIITQSDFIAKMCNRYEATKAHIIGPDIVTPSGMHQSPHRNHIFTETEAKKKLIIKLIFLYYFYAKKNLHLENKISVLEKWFDKIEAKNQSLKEWDQEQQAVVLQGACIIYTPPFIFKENVCFLPDTFMYGEEDLLARMCEIKGYRVLYTPKLSVMHLNGESTKKVYTESIDKKIFTYRYIVEGWKIYLKKYRENENQ